MWAKLQAWWQSLWITKSAASNDLNTNLKPPESTNITWEIPSYHTARKLAAKLETLIDEKLMQTSASEFKAACLSKDANFLVYLAGKALVDIGVREKTNNNDGELVELIQKIAGGVKGHPWCMYFVMVCVAYAESKTGKKSKIYNSGSCASVRKNSAGLAIDYKNSKAGDIWIWRYPSTGNGHTGVFGGWLSKYKAATLKEGNTTSGKIGDKIVREGGGAYTTEREVITNTKASMYLAMVIRPF